MLHEHLSQEHDAASRRSHLIEQHVAFIERTVLPAPSRVLDLGCGPGLYATKLAERGHEVFGVDFAPAAIEYAWGMAVSRGLSCRFEQADIRAIEFGRGYDLVMLLSGELNLFERHEAVDLLRRFAAALAPSGRVILEVHSHGAVRTRASAPPAWSTVPTGLFSDEPHLRADETFWSEADATASGRHWIVDAASAEVTLYGWSMLAYTEAEYEDLLAEAGLKLQGRFASLTGEPGDGDFPVLLAST
jgi:SAM-dependent methyltransferase